MISNNKYKGIAAGIVAAVAYGTNPLFGLPLMKAGIHPSSLLIYRFIMAACLIALLIKFSGQHFSVTRKQNFWLVIQGNILAVTALTLFLSFSVMDSGLAATLLFVYPVLVMVIMICFFHEKLRLSTILGTAGALAGIVMLQAGGNEGRINPQGVCYVMISAFTYSLYIIAIRQTPLKEISSEKITFYSLLYGIPLLLVPLRGGIDLQMLPDWRSFGYIIGLALLPAGLSFIMTAKAVKFAGPTVTAILGALEPLTALLIGITVFGERLSLSQSGGVLLIIGAVIIIISGQREKNPEHLEHHSAPKVPDQISQLFIRLTTPDKAARYQSVYESKHRIFRE